MTRFYPAFVDEVERVYYRHIGFRVFTMAFFLFLAWVFGIRMGIDTLIDAENVVRRDAVYNGFEIRSSGKRGRTKTLIVYFEDGTQAKAEIDALWLADKLTSLGQGTELSLTLDASEKRLLGVRHGTDTFLYERASIRLLNIKAWGLMVLGAIMFLTVLALIVLDVQEGLKKRT